MEQIRVSSKSINLLPSMHYSIEWREDILSPKTMPHPIHTEKATTTIAHVKIRLPRIMQGWAVY
jgi:hypothetical protein